MSGNSEEIMQEEKPFHVNNFVKNIDIRVVFMFKNKTLIHQSKESKLPCSLKTDGGDHCIVVSVLQHLRYLLKCDKSDLFNLWSLYFSCGFCSSLIVLLFRDRFFFFFFLL